MRPTRSTYSSFWMQFQKVMRDMPNACRCFPQGELWTEPCGKLGQESESRLKEPILLMNLPNTTQIAGSLDAIVDYSERFLPECPSTPSTVSTSIHYYLRQIQHAPQQLCAFRFECHPAIGCDDGDPIAHAHVESKPPHRYPVAYQSKKPVQIPAELKNPYFVFIEEGRIPAPFLPFPGVLYKIVADHYRRRVMTLMDKTSMALPEIPMPARYRDWQMKCMNAEGHSGGAWYRY